jgi:hypothetical protein
VRVHDLKHTFGRRLREAGVSFDDRQDLLGHKSDRITTHYSQPEIKNLIEAANKVCRPEDDFKIVNAVPIAAMAEGKAGRRLQNGHKMATAIPLRRKSAQRRHSN